jgi:SAM-dependent methyltransferase
MVTAAKATVTTTTAIRTAAAVAKQKCPLCQEPASHFYLDARTVQNYFKCGCGLYFLNPNERLSSDQELERYELHRNDLNSEDYQNFVAPLAREISNRVPPGASGLDFGCGPAPIMAHILGLAGYRMSAYDPYFNPDYGTLNKRFDFVVASEVAEHFYSPAVEFRNLKAMIKPGGVLGLMTLLVTQETDFSDWYYRRDPTHVVFYSEDSLQWIKRRFGFQRLEILDQRTVVFEV